jgi:hypothetical protein
MTMTSSDNRIKVERLLPQLRTLGDEIVWLAKQEITSGECQETDRHVDPKDPAPRVGVRYPAAQRRTDDRRNQGSETEQGHRHALFFGRESVEQHPLTTRLQTAARQALDHSKQDELTESTGEAAQQGAKCEYRDRREKVVAATEMRAQPTRNRQDDGIGGKVTGDNPLAVIGRRRQSARDIAQRDQRDRGIEHLHEGRHHDDGRHQPRVRSNTRPGRRERRDCHLLAPGELPVEPPVCASGARVCKNFPASGPTGGLST